MGTSSSQVRLLSLTSRKHDVSRELTTLSRRKQALARESREASLEYNSSFNANIYRWSAGTGSYTDISYSALMSPTSGVGGASKPILLTDMNGRVVVSDKYIKYAKMISPNGEPDNNGYSGDTRIAILSEVTGISEDEIRNSQEASEKVDTAEKALNQAYKDKEKYLAENKEPTVENVDLKDLVTKKFSSSDIKNAYNSSDKNYQINNLAGFKTLIDSIKNSMKNKLAPEDYAAWEEACDTTYTINQGAVDNVSNDSDKNNGNNKFSGEDGKRTVNIETLLKDIISAYKFNGGRGKENSTGEFKITTVDVTDKKWIAWDAQVKEHDKAIAEATTAWEVAVEADNMIFDEEKERRIRFYDQLFTAIAEQGWIYDDKAGEDSAYLNDMLQNNAYCLTLMSQNYDYDPSCPNDLTKKNKYDYTVGSAYYNDNLIKVNDPDVKAEALAVYESKKAEINAKESAINLRMDKLQTELKAINNMIDSITKVRDDNTEEYFGIFA